MQGHSLTAGGDDATPVNLTDTQLAYVRRALLTDLMEVAEDLREHAHRAIEPDADRPDDTIAGVDAESAAKVLLPCIVEVLDAIGWDVRGDASLLVDMERAQRAEGER